jgi:hypothetical protein
MRLLKATIAKFTKDDAFSLSAALAYYTLLSLAPLLVLLVGIAGLVWGNDATAQERFLNELRPLVGSDVAETLKSLLANIDVERTGLASTIVGAGTLLLGASGVFYIQWLPPSSTILMMWNWVLSLAIPAVFFGLVFRFFQTLMFHGTMFVLEQSPHQFSSRWAT